MKLLISADSSAPRFEGVQLLAAARRAGFLAHLFDHPASRDPTLELPTIVRAVGAELVLLVTPAREDPATLQTVRALGAQVFVWTGEGAADSPPWMDARRRWIASGADRVFVTDAALVEGLKDRLGRPAEVLAPAWDAETLGIVPATGGPAGSAASDRPDRSGLEDPVAPLRFVSVRGADDPLRTSGPVSTKSLLAFGDASAFPSSVRPKPMIAPQLWSAALREGAYLDGAHARRGPPGVFCARSAASAAGAPIYTLGFGAPLSTATRLPAASGPTFVQQLRQIIERAND